MKAPHEALTAEHVAQILGEAAEFGEAEIGEYLRDVRSFAADGVMTNNAGFTIRLEDGSEFQVTVVQSRHTHPDYLPEDGTLENPDARTGWCVNCGDKQTERCEINEHDQCAACAAQFPVVDDDDDDVNHQRLMNGADPTVDPDGRDDPDAFLEGEFLAERVWTPDGFGTCIQYDRDHNHAAVDLDKGGTWNGPGDDIQLESEWRADMEDIDRTAFGHDGSQVTHRHNDICADCNKICAPGELDEHDLCRGCAAEYGMAERYEHDAD